MNDVHLIREEGAASASIVMMVAVLIVAGIAVILGALAYNGQLFRAAAPADQGTTVNIEGDLNVPPAQSPGGDSSY